MSDPGPMLRQQHVDHLCGGAGGKTIGGEPAQARFWRSVRVERESLQAPRQVGFVFLHEDGSDAAESRVVSRAAEVGAFMDVITGGKFLLGIGLGYRPEEYDMFGVQMAERASRLAEGVAIIRRLWGEDRVTHRGRHWQFSDATIRPRPLQSPSPPIIIGA